LQGEVLFIFNGMAHRKIGLFLRTLQRGAEAETSAAQWRTGHEKAPPTQHASQPPEATPEAVTFLDHWKRLRARIAANPGALSHTARALCAIDSEKTLL